MEDLIREFLSLKKIAVVGSFRNEQKVAYQIVRNLLSRGYEVYPVNPNTKEVAGLKCYKSIIELPDGIEGLDIVTPPMATEKIVEDALKKGIRNIWIQPGAESEKAVRFCEDNNMSVIHNLCIMVTW